MMIEEDDNFEERSLINMYSYLASRILHIVLSILHTYI